MKQNNIREYLTQKLSDIFSESDINNLVQRYRNLERLAKRENLKFELTPREFYYFIISSDFIKKHKEMTTAIILVDKSKAITLDNLVCKTRAELNQIQVAKDWLITFKNGDVVTVRSLYKFYNTHKHYFNQSYSCILRNIKKGYKTETAVIANIKKIKFEE